MIDWTTWPPLEIAAADLEPEEARDRVGEALREALERARARARERLG